MQGTWVLMPLLVPSWVHLRRVLVRILDPDTVPDAVSVRTGTNGKPGKVDRKCRTRPIEETDYSMEVYVYILLRVE